MSASRCDKCGETVADIDAGFSPGLHKMRHECGGTWRIVRPGRPALPPELKRTARLSMRTYQDVADKAARVGTAAVEAAIRRIKEPSQ